MDSKFLPFAAYSGCDINDAKLGCLSTQLVGKLAHGACKFIRDEQAKEDCENGSDLAGTAVVQACALAKSQLCNFDQCPQNKFESAFCKGAGGLTSPK